MKEMQSRKRGFFIFLSKLLWPAWSCISEWLYCQKVRIWGNWQLPVSAHPHILICMRECEWEKEKKSYIAMWLLRQLHIILKNLDFWCLCCSWKNMQYVSLQLSGRLIYGLLSKWSTGGSMGCVQATWWHSTVATFARLCTYTASERSGAGCLSSWDTMAGMVKCISSPMLWTIKRNIATNLLPSFWAFSQAKFAFKIVLIQRCIKLSPRRTIFRMVLRMV